MRLSKSIKKLLICGSALIMIGGISNGVANLATPASTNVSAKARKSRVRKPRYRKNYKRRNRRVSRKHLRKRASRKRNRKVVHHHAKKNKKTIKHHMMKRHARKQRKHGREAYRIRNKKNKRVIRHRNKRHANRKVRKHKRHDGHSRYIPIYGNGSSVTPSSSANVPASSASNDIASSSAQSNNDENNDDFSGFNFNFGSSNSNTPVAPSHINSNANKAKPSASSVDSQASSNNNNTSSSASSRDNKPNSQGLLPGEYYEYGYLQPGDNKDDNWLDSNDGTLHFSHSFLVRAKNPYANWTPQQFRAEFPHIKQLINDYIIPAYHDEGPAYDTSDSYDAGNPTVVKIFQFKDATPIESQKSYIQGIQGSNAQEAY